MSKECTKCQKVKDLTEFYKDKSHRDGCKTRCKTCEGKYIPTDTRCIKCSKWFTKKTLKHKFCSIKCGNRHYTFIYSKSGKWLDTNRRYLVKHRKELNEKSKAWYWANREKALVRSIERYYTKKELLWKSMGF